MPRKSACHLAAQSIWRPLRARENSHHLVQQSTRATVTDVILAPAVGVGSFVVFLIPENVYRFVVRAPVVRAPVVRVVRVVLVRAVDGRSPPIRPPRRFRTLPSLSRAPLPRPDKSVGPASASYVSPKLPNKGCVLDRQVLPTTATCMRLRDSAIPVAMSLNCAY